MYTGSPVCTGTINDRNNKNKKQLFHYGKFEVTKEFEHNNEEKALSLVSLVW